MTKTVSKTVDWNLEGQRHLKTRLKCSGATQTLVFRFRDTVSGEDKSYTVVTGTADTFDVYTIDLCMPDDMTDNDDTLDDSVYTQESRYPLTGGATTPPSLSDATWGVNHVAEVSITFTDGQTVSIDYIDAARHTSGYAEATWLPAFEPWKSVYTSTSGKSAFWTEADGRVSDFTLQTLSGASYAWQSVTGHIADIATRLGWTTGLGGPFPTDGYHSNSLEALLVGGGGVAFDWGATWEGWIGRDMTSATNVVAQMLWDEAVGYPTIGEAWTGGAYGNPLKLRCGKVNRGQMWGLVHKATVAESSPGVIVTLKTHPGAVYRGSGTSGGLGEYSTLAPFGQKASHKGYAASLVSPAFTVYDRMKHRRCWLVDAEAGGTTYVSGPDLAHFVAYIDADGNVVAERADSTLDFESATQSFQASFVHYGIDGKSPYTLRLCYADAGTCYTRTSRDGLAFSSATSRGTGTRMVSVGLRDGGHFEYKYDAGDIDGQLYDNAGTAVGAAFTATTGVDDVQFDAHTSSTGGNSFRIVLVCIKSGTRTVMTSPDGVVFT